MSDSNSSSASTAEPEINIAEIAKQLAAFLPMDHDRALQSLDTSEVANVAGILDKVAEFSKGQFEGKLGVDLGSKLLTMKRDTLEPVISVFATIRDTLTEAKKADELNRRTPILTGKIAKLRANYIYGIQELKDFVTSFKGTVAESTELMQQALKDAETYKLSPDQQAEYKALIEFLPKISEAIDQRLSDFVVNLGLNSQSMLKYFDQLNTPPAQLKQK